MSAGHGLSRAEVHKADASLAAGFADVLPADSDFDEIALDLLDTTLTSAGAGLLCHTGQLRCPATHYSAFAPRDSRTASDEVRANGPDDGFEPR
jgi:hypothetical protein